MTALASKPDGRSSAVRPMLSLIICTYNPKDAYFRRCLAALEAQTLPRDDWELVVVDNHSAEPVAGRYDLSWHPSARVVREDKLGLTPARLRGISEAAGDLLVFVDDDNILDADYLRLAVEIGRDHPHLGSWSGQCIAEFESEPSAWTRRYWGNLCIREFDTRVWSNLPRLGETMPAGAGLCVRRAVAQQYLDLHHAGGRKFQFDRTGTSLISGGDNDLAACACRIGLGVGLFPELTLHHIIPPDRLDAGYLARLAEGIAFSSILLDAEWGLEVPRRGRLGGLVDFLRLQRLKEPHRSIIRAAYRGRDRAADLVHQNQSGAGHP